MSQPDWREVWSTDCSALYTDATGVYPPELEYAAEIEDCPPAERFIVYRVVLEGPYTLVNGRLQNAYGHRPWFEDDYHPMQGPDIPHSDNRFCVSCGQWVSRRLTEAARCCGESPSDLRMWFCSDDVNERAAAHEIVASTHGWENFDSYPLRMSEEELETRWEKARRA